MVRIEEDENGVTIAIKVVPNASKNEIVGCVGDRLKVRVKSPPERGKANDAVCFLIANALQLKKSAVSVISGNTNSKKTVGIIGSSVDAVCSKLGL